MISTDTLLWLDFLLFFVLLIIGLVLAIQYYFEKIAEKKRQNPEGAAKYGRELIVGIVSGIVVLVLDRIITPIFMNVPKFSFENLAISLQSALIWFVMALAGVLFAILLALYIINKGVAP